MTTGIEVTAILCDAAQAADGKLNVLGGGFTRLSAPGMPTNMSLGLIVHVPWDQANERFQIETVLVDEDGQQVEIEGNKVQGAGELEVGRPAGLKQGERLNVPLAMNFNGIVLPGGGYVWECRLQGEVVARCPFRVAIPVG